MGTFSEKRKEDFHPGELLVVCESAECLTEYYVQPISEFFAKDLDKRIGDIEFVCFAGCFWTMLRYFSIAVVPFHSDTTS